MEDEKTFIQYLFHRPYEPIHLPKGDGGVIFDVGSDHRPPAHEFSIMNSDDGLKVVVKPVTLPDLTIPKQLGRRSPFSLFIPMHQRCANHLIDIFMNTKTYDEFLSTAVHCHDLVNPNLYIYALSVAVLHHPETKHLDIPPLYEIFPDKYINASITCLAREEAYVAAANSREVIEIPKDFTASDLDEEHRLAYWREDLGINLHHWHWHLVYPHGGNIKIVNKDRRGELFYYMHEQMLARYNCERLCNRLARVKRLINWRDPIFEGYFPKLSSNNTAQNWPSRPSGSFLRDVNRPQDGLNFDIQDLERWRDRILEAIYKGYVLDTKGERVLLTERNGIDILGNIVEASILSPNQNVYGDLHNSGHVAIATCHDPDYRHLEALGVMGDIATAMRDPLFYRWHAFIDDVFQQHKDMLPPYTKQQLDFPDVKVERIRVKTKAEHNVLKTFWMKSEVDLDNGLDFSPRGPLIVKFTHLNNACFWYKIVVNNNGSSRKGTVRIFMAPKEDERGLPFPFAQQKNLMIEMDKFVVTLDPGRNTINRKSTESSVTIPFERTFPNVGERKRVKKDDDSYCGCGWPQHMLLPLGTKEGFKMQLFVMVSDYKNDVVETYSESCCKNAISYCGLKDKKYPDAQAMGFPFDRPPRSEVENLKQFLTDNMSAVDITIQFTDSVKSKCKSKCNDKSCYTCEDSCGDTSDDTSDDNCDRDSSYNCDRNRGRDCDRDRDCNRGCDCDRCSNHCSDRCSDRCSDHCSDHSSDHSCDNNCD